MNNKIDHTQSQHFSLLNNNNDCNPFTSSFELNNNSSCMNLDKEQFYNSNKINNLNSQLEINSSSFDYNSQSYNNSSQHTIPLNNFQTNFESNKAPSKKSKNTKKRTYSEINKETTNQIEINQEIVERDSKNSETGPKISNDNNILKEEPKTPIKNDNFSTGSTASQELNNENSNNRNTHLYNIDDNKKDDSISIKSLEKSGDISINIADEKIITITDTDSINNEQAVSTNENNTKCLTNFTTNNKLSKLAASRGKIVITTKGLTSQSKLSINQGGSIIKLMSTSKDPILSTGTQTSLSLSNYAADSVQSHLPTDCQTINNLSNGLQVW